MLTTKMPVNIKWKYVDEKACLQDLLMVHLPNGVEKVNPGHNFIQQPTIDSGTVSPVHSGSPKCLSSLSLSSLQSVSIR